jgi:hypothetical protein
MNTKQAKDFLVQQTAEQAALDGVALSEVEKKMMYFTESDPVSCEYPYEINDEFEAQCETAEYEGKISRLLRRAYDRLKQEDPERKRLWDQAIRKLREGDHYFLILWDAIPPSDHPRLQFFRVLGSSLLLLVVVGIALVLFDKFRVDPERQKIYSMILILAMGLLLSGSFPGLYRAVVGLVRRRRTEDE